MEFEGGVHVIRGPPPGALPRVEGCGEVLAASLRLILFWLRSWSHSGGTWGHADEYMNYYPAAKSPVALVVLVARLDET